MDCLTELKQFVKLHAVSQGIKKSLLNKTLNNITHVEGEKSGSWTWEFTSIGDVFYQQKKYNKAIGFYNLARFTYINNQEKRSAAQKCITAFNHWNQKNDYGFERDEFHFDQKAIPFYCYKSKNTYSPLLIIIGGIVSTKEQWSNILNLAKKLDITAVVLEMPGVGENSDIYSKSSFELFHPLIEKMKDFSNTNQVHIIGMSFGGNLAIKYALKDNRVKSIFTVGAPIFHFFRNNELFEKVPNLTKIILSNLCAVEKTSIFDTLQQFSISSQELSSLNIPIHYVFSSKDEIIPLDEKISLEKNVKKLNLYQFNDVHGSPHHMLEIKLLLVRYILSLSKRKKILYFFLGRFLSFLSFGNKFNLGETV